jgi:trehalose-phosphatase
MCPLPNALTHLTELKERQGISHLAVCLDYDGTLTPIVERPDLAVLAPDMRDAIETLSQLCTVAIVSGRDRADVERLVGLDGLIYAGSHGFDIVGPNGLAKEHERAAEFLPALDRAEALLRERLHGVAGALVERKKFAIAVHDRRVAEGELEGVRRAADEVAAEVPGLRRTGGKRIHELRPQIDWDKGRAVLWLLASLGLDRPDALPIYIGDDETDEDAFAALPAQGLGILVSEQPRPSHASFRLADIPEVEHFLEELAGWAEELRR